MELTSSLMEKIALLEQKIEKQAQEIHLKDERIAELEEKIKTLQKGEVSMSVKPTTDTRGWSELQRAVNTAKFTPAGKQRRETKKPTWSFPQDSRSGLPCPARQPNSKSNPAFSESLKGFSPIQFPGIQQLSSPSWSPHTFPAMAKLTFLDKAVVLHRNIRISPTDASDSSTTEELEMRCLQLQRQVWEMERFLNDYGLIWVGETRDQLEETESLQDEEELPGNLWKPGEDIVCQPQIDFDLILENVKDLNSLVGEGISQIEHTARGARLRRPEPLPLILYQNGIILGNGAFRPYQHPATQQCLQDIMDGYFPSELQPHYPDGIPLQVTDRRDVVFQKQDHPGSFPGLGQMVGTSESSKVQETSEITGPKASLEQFPNKLSKPLKHRGRVGSARGVARAAPQGSDGQQSSREILVGSSRLAALERYRVKPTEEAEARAPDFCTLRIKSESGEQTYEVKMLLTDTIGDLRQHLAHIRGGNSDSYEIISTFPQRVYTDNSRSLQECGLVPNASLLLRRKDLSQQEGMELQTA